MGGKIFTNFVVKSQPSITAFLRVLALENPSLVFDLPFALTNLTYLELAHVPECSL